MRTSRMLWVALVVLLAGSIAAYAQGQDPEPSGVAVEAAPAGETLDGATVPEESGGAEEAPELEPPVDPFADVVPVHHCGDTGFHAGSKAECQASCSGGSVYVNFTGCCYCE